MLVNNSPQEKLVKIHSPVFLVHLLIYYFPVRGNSDSKVVISMSILVLDKIQNFGNILIKYIFVFTLRNQFSKA